MKFEHDCELCRPIGADDEFDFYVCDQALLGPSLIARHGNAPREYASMPLALALREESGEAPDGHPISRALVAYRNNRGG